METAPAVSTQLPVPRRGRRLRRSAPLPYGPDKHTWSPSKCQWHSEFLGSASLEPVRQRPDKHSRNHDHVPNMLPCRIQHKATSVAAPMHRSPTTEVSRLAVTATATFVPRYATAAIGTMMKRIVTNVNDQSHEAASPLPKITGSNSVSTNKALRPISVFHPATRDSILGRSFVVITTGLRCQCPRQHIPCSRPRGTRTNLGPRIRPLPDRAPPGRLSGRPKGCACRSEPGHSLASTAGCIEPTPRSRRRGLDLDRVISGTDCTTFALCRSSNRLQIPDTAARSTSNRSCRRAPPGQSGSPDHSLRMRIWFDCGIPQKPRSGSRNRNPLVFPMSDAPD